MKIVEYVKEHPLTVAGVVAGGLVLYLLYSSASGGSSVAAVAGPTDAQVQANTALQIAQLNQTGQINALHEQFAAALAANNTAVALKTLDVQMGGHATDVAGTVSLAGISAQQTLGLAADSTQQQIAKYAQETNQKQIQAGVDIAATTGQVYEALAGFNAQTVQASYAANVAIEQSRDNAATTQNAAQQKTAQKSSSNSLIGNIAGGLISVLPFLFSDERLKTDIRTAGFDARGRRWVDFRYTWDAPNITRRGVIAQEILRSDPHAVKKGPFGFLLVNYGALN